MNSPLGVLGVRGRIGYQLLSEREIMRYKYM
jgi:hypothetical protein